jgi:hypothetical protein
MKLVFISGPMTGIPDHNRPVFHAAAKQLRDHGYHVINPAELRPEDHQLLNRCTRRDLQILLAFPVEGLATLPDGPEIHPDFPPSRGMAVERNLAKTCLHVPVATVSQWLSCSPDIGVPVDITMDQATG